MEDLNLVIGENLNRIRNNKKLSLEEVSNFTGVSKSMLGQIENGKTNPTVSTLWKISTGLKVPFSSFIEKQFCDYEFVDVKKISHISENNDKMRIYPVFPFDSKKNFEILVIDLDKNCKHISPKHDDGVEEYIMVTDGKLKITLYDKEVILEKGCCIRYTANVEHTYENFGDGQCTFHNIIVYS
ncbi:MAG: helix-turn-helix transcriptional regulator [Clostridioides difficile]|nr:helix-turn-helix transcriptional regulator [Clostridioides difficile]